MELNENNIRKIDRSKGICTTKKITQRVINESIVLDLGC